MILINKTVCTEKPPVDGVGEEKTRRESDHLVNGQVNGVAPEIIKTVDSGESIEK